MDLVKEKSVTIKRKRGRPRKNPPEEQNIDNNIELTEESGMHPCNVPGPESTRNENVTENEPGTSTEERTGYYSRNLFENINRNDFNFDGVSLLNQQPNRGRSFMDLSNVLPNFDPVDNGVDVNQWIEKIEEYKDMYMSDDLATRHYALSKL